MQPDRPPHRRSIARHLAPIWGVLALAAALIQAGRVWSALTAGETRFYFSLQPFPVSRTAQPLLFHAALLASMLIALVCLAAAYAAWRRLQNPG